MIGQSLPGAAQVRAGNADLLTRTTLELDGEPSPAAICEMIRALQHVPGVLLVELDPGRERTVVAHDAAVLRASLLDAAAATGVRVRFVTDTRTSVPATTLQPLAGKQLRRLLILATVFALLPIVIEGLFPRLPGDLFIVPILLSSVAAFIIALAIFGRRP